MVENGIRIFRINGAYCHFHHYERIISDIRSLFKRLNENPTIIFDLKGRVPRITKISYGLQKLSFEKGDIVKFICGDQKINDDEIVHIDRNIIDSVQVGDRIVIDSSGCILKVLKIDYYKKERQYNIKGFKEAKSFSNLPLTNQNEFWEDYDNNNKNNNSHIDNFFSKKKIYGTDDEESLVSYSLQNSSNIINNSENQKEKNFNIQMLVENSAFNLNKDINNNNNFGNINLNIENTELGENDNIILEGIELNISPIVKKINAKNPNHFQLNNNLPSKDLNLKNTIKQNEPIIELIDEESKNEDKLDSPFFDVDRNFNSDAEETFKNKQDKITEVYKSIVKKHTSKNDVINVKHSKFGCKDEQKQILLSESKKVSL